MINSCNQPRRWVAFLNKAERLKRNRLPAQLKEDPAIVKAVAELERIGLNPKERAIYEAEVKARMANQSELKTAREEGIEVGVQQGVQRVLLRQMARRIGEVPGNISNRLYDLSPTELDDLSEALFDFHSYTEVEKWLTSH